MVISYDEYINPRILTRYSDTFRLHRRVFTSITLTLTVTVPRYGKIKLIYEDRHGKQCNMQDIEDDKLLAATLQRKIDYTFGGNPT